MYFPSKKDVWLFLLLWGTILVCTVSIFTTKDLLATFILLPIDILLIWFWFTTGYCIKEEQLIVTFGPFKSKIDIKEIRKMRRTKNPLSAPALSMDRIEISYGKFFDIALVSPKDKRVFVAKLLEINPIIELDESLKK